METNMNRDHELWKKANERANFKMHLIIYFIVTAFLWVIWAFIGYLNEGNYNQKWPLYPMFGWGLGVALHYIIVFSWKQKITQKEYDKLLRKGKLH
jgi:membrane protease YdiL (CAAX protease family)